MLIDEMNTEENSQVVRMRGLPYECADDDISSFFNGLQIADNGISIIEDQHGRSMGYAYVEFTSMYDADLAMKKDRETMGSRYIELFKATKQDMVGHTVHMRGLPFRANKQDVLDFFQPLVPVKVNLLRQANGRPKGECYADFATRLEAEAAMQKDKQEMGHRYIELFLKSTTRGDAVMTTKPSISPPRRVHDFNRDTKGAEDLSGSSVVRRRGLPFECSDAEVKKFFQNLQIVGNGIQIVHDHKGRSMGYGYVEFISASEAEKAILRNKKRIGHRYIELFKATKEDMLGHTVHMRGLPFRATRQNVLDFFAPLVPCKVTMFAKGECYVDFDTSLEAEAAMQKDRAEIGDRYIELFLKSTSMPK